MPLKEGVRCIGLTYFHVININFMIEAIKSQPTCNCLVGVGQPTLRVNCEAGLQTLALDQAFSYGRCFLMGSDDSVT